MGSWYFGSDSVLFLEQFDAIDKVISELSFKL